MWLSFCSGVMLDHAVGVCILEVHVELPGFCQGSAKLPHSRRYSSIFPAPGQEELFTVLQVGADPGEINSLLWFNVPAESNTKNLAM